MDNQDESYTNNPYSFSNTIGSFVEEKKEQTDTESDHDDLKTKKRGKCLMFVILGMLLLLIIIGVIVFFIISGQNRYVDKQYNFVIENKKGWHQTEVDDGSHYALATLKDYKDKIIESYFNVVAIERTGKGSYYDEIYKKLCLMYEKELGYKLVDQYDIQTNKMKGYTCYYEGTNPTTSLMYILQTYYLYCPSQESYNYMINVTYPKGNSEQLVLVENLLRGFHTNCDE